MKETRILQIVPKLEIGGIGMMLLNYYREVIKISSYRFDFVVHGNDIGELESIFNKMESSIYHVTPKTENYFKYKNELCQIMNQKEYLIVHAHQNSMSYIPLKIAKQNNIMIRIAHSHSCILNPNIKDIILRNYSIPKIKRFATNLAYCSESSKKWVFGENANGHLITNPVDLDKFKFSNVAREEIRTKLKLNDKIVIGYIGRLDKEKNIPFILNVIAKLPDHYHFLIVGGGNEYSNLLNLTEKLNIRDKVSFLGSKIDAYKYYNAFDIFVLPSFFEAFPVSLIEAQTNGLKIIVSENIPEDVFLTNLITKLSISNVKNWLNTIIDLDCNYQRNFNNELECFSSSYLSKDLIHYYDSLISSLM